MGLTHIQDQSFRLHQDLTLPVAIWLWVRFVPDGLFRPRALWSPTVLANQVYTLNTSFCYPFYSWELFLTTRKFLCGLQLHVPFPSHTLADTLVQDETTWTLLSPSPFAVSPPSLSLFLFPLYFLLTSLRSSFCPRLFVFRTNVIYLYIVSFVFPLAVGHREHVSLWRLA